MGGLHQSARELFEHVSFAVYGKSTLFCHSERSEEFLFGLNASKERFLGTRRASE
jgi:hypothetical protein